MGSPPSSPKSPSQHRRTSSTHFSDTSPRSNYSFRSRNNSTTSYTSNNRARPASSRSQDLGGEIYEDEKDGVIDGSSNGLGNLADELAEAWDEDYQAEISEIQTREREGSYDSNFNYDLQDGGDSQDEEDDEIDGETETGMYIETVTDIGFGPIDGPSSQTEPMLSPKSAHRHSRIRNKSLYDGSDYGDDDEDLETAAGLSPGLEAQMAAIEALVRVGTQNNGSDMDDVVDRLVERLEDLGSQSSVENNTTRLITAHTALSSHIAYQTRNLQSLTYPLLSPLSSPLSPEAIDALLPLLLSTFPLVPQPTSSAMSSLISLSSATSDIISTLNYLSDTLHMSRQTTTAATRRLRSTKELVAEMHREEEEREEGIRWIEKGNWQERLSKRECAGVCKDVVGGFEEVCKGFRERLLEGQA